MALRGHWSWLFGHSWGLAIESRAEAGWGTEISEFRLWLRMDNFVPTHLVDGIADGQHVGTKPLEFPRFFCITVTRKVHTSCPSSFLVRDSFICGLVQKVSAIGRRLVISLSFKETQNCSFKQLPMKLLKDILPDLIDCSLFPLIFSTGHFQAECSARVCVRFKWKGPPSRL